MSRNYGGIAHTWASLNKEKGKNGNIFFEGPTIYSYGYHFPMATFIDDNTVFVTTGTYSSSTASHMRAVESALRGLPVEVFRVQHVLHNRHADNLVDMHNTVAQLLEKSIKARQRKFEYVAKAQELHAHMSEYAARFVPSAMVNPLDDDYISKTIADGMLATKAEEDKQKAREEILREQAVEDLAAWREGNIIFFRESHLLPTALRIKGDNIETSRGAIVPSNVASLLWRIITKRRSGALDHSVSGLRIGDFNLREVTANGDLIIGCHTILYDELEHMAKQLGFSNVS